MAIHSIVVEIVVDICLVQIGGPTYRHCHATSMLNNNIKTTFSKDQHFFLKHLFTGVRSVQVVGRELGTSGENSPLCHLVAALSAGGDIHRVLQQHGHHHPVPAHTGLNGKLMSTRTHTHTGVNTHLLLPCI